MACWTGTQGQVKLAQKAKTCPHYDITHRKPKMKKHFFQCKVEDFLNPLAGLNSSLAQLASELWYC